MKIDFHICAKDKKRKNAICGTNFGHALFYLFFCNFIYFPHREKSWQQENSNKTCLFKVLFEILSSRNHLKKCLPFSYLLLLTFLHENGTLKKFIQIENNPRHVCRQPISVSKFNTLPEIEIEFTLHNEKNGKMKCQFQIETSKWGRGVNISILVFRWFMTFRRK